MIKSYKPTSAGIRFRKTLVKDISKVKPEKSLLKPLKGSAGRNKGKVSVRHKQRGAKKYYRFIDFKRNKQNILGKVATLEHDPNRNCNIALIHYIDGEKRYILVPQGLKIGDQVLSAQDATLEVGNCLPLSRIPLGTKIHNIEINPQGGGHLVRGAGTSATLMAKEGNYVNIRLPSGEVKKFLDRCSATIGELSNPDFRNARAGKAGIKRHLGSRPEVRGVVMGVHRHPHGGSYSTTGIGMPSPKTPWGKKARGVKTRKRAYTNKFVVTKRLKRR
ncbi:50S ribosomal protein L2 [candidate division WWE3 bacterium RBG_19FT_COMBO_34_6]|uniref:50S ribosomal protein L2 n=1 Tax=candidate division WWE3 bacterium RBG_19FT_COMBO_34_6 TaxID=1802612 RepID=A0A1F4UJX2_UNCKA|nr:MAG: 50S ribosomal protein L2 [candidate division WWE3 bacterium RBG_19FT_COMBO_34_6]